MYALATCRASILRGTTTDDFGDVVDSSTVVQSNVLAQITERSQVVQDPNSLTPRTVRDVRGFVPSDIDISANDRLRDDTHGVVYIVVEVVRPGGPAYSRDIALQLKRVD